MTRLPRPRPILSSRAAASLLLGCAGAAAIAQTQPASQLRLPAPLARPAGDAVDGRTFAGARFTTDTRPGGVSLAARNASAWSDGATRRLLLTGDVRIAVAGRAFVADRAVIWLESPPPGPPTPADESPRTQVAVYATNLRDPAAAPDRSVRADRLLVTAVVTGDTTLRADILRQGRPEGDPLLREAEERLARHVRGIVSPQPAPPPRQIRSRPAPWTLGEPPVSTPATGEQLANATPARPPAQPSPRPPGPTEPEPILPLPALKPSTAGPDAGAAEPGAPMMPAPEPSVPSADVAPQDQSLGPAEPVIAQAPEQGTVTFFGPTREFISGVNPGESAVAITGGVAVQYLEISTGRTLQLTSESAVVFLAKGGLRELADTGRGLNADDVIGAYLEGNVVMTDGRYTMRAPRVYADIRRRRAIFLDAVFWTYERLRGAPLFVRADAIRVESENQFAADNVRLSNSAFFEPALALGASSVTITRTPREPRDEWLVDAQGGALLLGGASVAPLPRYRGDPGDSSALQEITAGTRDGKAVVRTRWDAFNLLDLERVPGLNVSILADGWFDRGPAFGVESSWNTPEIRGSFLGYYFYDDGEDRLSSGSRIGRTNENRGVVLFDNLLRLDQNWDLFTEASYVSDPAFIDSMFRALGKERREFTSSVYLRRRDEASVFSAEARGSFNNFTPNEYLLQSQGYQVERLPEARYSRVADPILDGALYWTQDTSAGRYALRFNEPAVNTFGFDTPELSRRAFGINPGQSIADRLRAMGLTEDSVFRFDTRHELEAPLKLGDFTLTPFAVGRFTHYDDRFETFSPTRENAERFYGGAGARLHTSIEHVDNSVDSRLFDLSRIRHIIEPSATIYYADSTRPSSTLPVFDRNVESLAEGPVARVGLTNTWQTYRGPRDEQRIVDWFVLRTDYVHGFRESEFTTPIGRWFEARPELSVLGRYIENQGTLQLTDALALSSHAVLNVDDVRLTYISGGVIIDHGEGFATFADVRHIEPIDTLKTDFGVRYAISRQYAATATVTADFQRKQLEGVVIDLERRFEQFSFTISFARDNISGQTGVGVSFQPSGLGEESRRRLLSRYGSTEVERLGQSPVNPIDSKPFRTTGTAWGLR